MDIVIFVILIIIIIISTGIIIYYKMNYIFVNKNDKKVLNSGFSFLDDNYLKNYVNTLEMQN